MQCQNQQSSFLACNIQYMLLAVINNRGKSSFLKKSSITVTEQVSAFFLNPVNVMCLMFLMCETA